MHSTLMTDLSIVMVVAAVTGLLTRRLGQPSILGYLLAGLIVGPYIPIPLFADPHRMEDLAEVGVVLVMLAVGLEFRVRRLLAILPVSGLTAAVQISLLGWAGFTVASVMGWSVPASITLGACLSISSTMVVSAVLRNQPVDADVRSNVFGILVVQDVVAIVLMAVVTALAAGQSVGAGSLAVLVAQLVAVVAGMLIVGLLVLPRLVRWVFNRLDAEALVVLVAGAGFGFALAAEQFGYSVALGAFIAGIAVAESGRGHDVEEAIEPLRALFSALFFVSIGMSVDPVVAWSSLPLAGALVVLVVTMQLVSVTVASLLSGSSLRRSIFSGLALGQIGELSFILATIAVAGGVAPEGLVPALVTVATVTAFTTPLLLRHGEAIVDLADRLMPRRVNDLLVAYHAFVRRLRSGPNGRRLMRPAIALALDWTALVVLVIARLTLAPHATDQWLWVLNLSAILIAVPFVLGLMRSGLVLTRAVRRIVHSGSTPLSVSRVIEVVALLAVVLAAGTPTLAVLRPVLATTWVESALLVVALLLLAVLIIRARGIRGEYSSGVARVALGLARHVGDASEPQQTNHVQHALAGLDSVPITVPADAEVHGQSLATVNLRVRTGATVVAIRRNGDTHMLPTGQERLCTDDVLEVSGSPQAVQRARALLTAQPAR